MVTRTYSVPDLIAFNHMVRGYHQDGLGPRLTQITRSADFEPLIELLTESVAPDTWTIMRFTGEEVPPEDTLPDGVLIPLPSSSKMVIRHTAEVHDEVRTRLEQMRRLVTALKSPPEVVEERIIGPELTETEVVEERLIGPESSPFELDRAREGEAREARGSDPFIPTPDQHSPFEPTPDQRNPFERRPAAGPTPDQRIESLEQKLDAILDELRAIRVGEKPEGVQGGDNSD
jgi:hypothetical protein